MANTQYIVTQIDSKVVDDVKNIVDKDSKLIDSFEINSTYNQSEHNIELHYYGFDGTLLQSIPNFKDTSLLGNAAGAGKRGASSVSLDPGKDAQNKGYENGDVRLLYRFTNNLFSNTNQQPKFFIENISPDRKEIRAISNEVVDNDIKKYSNEILSKLNSTSYFSEFFINFGDNKTTLCVNIDTENLTKGQAIVIKLYEQLPDEFTINSTFTVEEEICDEVLFEVKANTVLDKEITTYLKGPNFNIELTDENNNPTEYFSYNELFSYPVTSSYFELNSLFNDKSAQIAIDHTDFNSFIHFSSAEERLRNFKYKLDLIGSYEESIDSINTTGYSRTGITGSLDYYQNLIKGVVNNFDHYDRFLYFESGSNSWPKSNLTRPYQNQSSTTSESITWYTNQLVAASNYDVSNFDILINTVPTFIREDSNNEPYLMFIHMIAQHFDNLWIYFKAVSDKYDTDNRLDFGVSKDLVRDAIESLGVKLYNSNQSLDNLFSLFTGETYQSGSELIDNVITATSGSSNSYLQPLPKDNYTKEVYKRIYHNLPLLLKSKGTERGLRALINSFGIPSSILPVKIFGGVNQSQTTYTGLSYVTSSLDKVRLDNTGSILTGSTLSRYASIETLEPKYSDDLHTVEIGFDISSQTNEFFTRYLPSKFNIDDYIGDPRDAYELHYHTLGKVREDMTVATWDEIITNWQSANWIWDDGLEFRTPGAFIRLIKFFDNSIFRVIKDFIPARSSINTGVVIKPDILTRNKVKQVSVEYTRPEYEASIKTGFISGSDGKAFGVANKHRYTTNYSSSIVTPLGRAPRNVLTEEPRFTGEFSGSLIVATDGELNRNNTFKESSQPAFGFNLTVFNLSLPLPPSCNIVLVANYNGEYFTFYAEDDGSTVEILYPTVVAPSAESIIYTNNFNVFEYISVEATSAYPSTFIGWYTQPNGGGTLIQTGSNLIITKDIEDLYGGNYYANFTEGYLY